MNNDFKSWLSKAKILGIADDFKFFPKDYNTNDIILVEYNGVQKKVIVPPVKTIYKGAFRYNQYVEEIIINPITTDIGPDCFSDCTNLKRVYFNCNTDVIKNGTFYNCNKLEYVNLPDDIMNIGPFAFMGCSKLESIDLKNIIILDEYSFSGSGIKEIVIPKSLKYLNISSFEGCKELKEITILSDDFSVEIGEEHYRFLDSSPIESIRLTRGAEVCLGDIISQHIINKIEYIEV